MAYYYRRPQDFPMKLFEFTMENGYIDISVDEAKQTVLSRVVLK